MKEAIISVLRHGLTALGVYFAARGVITEDAAQSAVAAFVTLVSVGWEVVATKKASDAAKA